MKSFLSVICALLLLVCGGSAARAAEAGVYLVKTLHLVDRVNHHVYIDLSEFGAGAHPISTMIRTRYTLTNGWGFYPGVTDYNDWSVLYPPEGGGGSYEDPDGDQIYRIALEYYYQLLSSPFWSLTGVSVEGNVSYWPGAPYQSTVVHNKQFSIAVPNVRGNLPPNLPSIPQVFSGFWM